MNKSVSYLVLVLVGCILLLTWLPVSAQGGDLLVNPGFEDPYNTLTGDPPIQIAQGWSPWHVPAAPGSPSFANRQPEYGPTAPDQSRILAGNNAQLISSFFATHVGGVYQRVTGVTSGAELHFSVNAYVWSTTFDNVDVSEEDGDVLVQVGIDPTGGTDGTSNDIVWSEAGVEQYDSYNQYAVEAEAEGTAVTVFVRTTVGVPVKNNNIYLDQASLTVVGTGQPTPSNTPIPPTNTNTPVPPTATNTSQPPTTTDTPVAGTETEEPGEDPVILTATAIVAQATQTANAAQTATADAPATATTDPKALTATAIITGATATSAARQTAAAITPSVTPTATATRVPLTDIFPGTVTHRVRRGESVFVIAELYGSSIEAIAEANGLGPNYLINVDQVLIVPVRIPNPATSTPTNTPPVVVVTATPSSPGQPPAAVGGEYIVRPGDTLLRIARQFNTTVATLAQLNGIVNVDRIQAGQRLRLPGGPAPAPTAVPPQQPQTYRIFPGDTLYRLSLRFGVSMAQLAIANNISNVNLIYAGQVIIIP